MNIRKKLAHLQDLPELQPDKLWVGKTKYELLSEISAQSRLMKAHRLNAVEKADLLTMSFLQRLSPSFARIAAGFLIIFMGSGLGIAAQASVPGQALWPVKRSIEKVELTFTISPVKETEIHIKHVNERLAEIDKILESQDSKPEAKVKQDKAIKQAVLHLEKDVTAADSSLKIAKAEKEPAEVVVLAKKVTDVAKEAVISLEANKTGADAAISKVLDDAQIINEEVKASAVVVALEVHQEVLAIEQQNAPVPMPTSTDNGLMPNTLEAPFDTSTPSMPLEYSDINAEDIATVKNLVAEIVSVEINEATQAGTDTKQAVDNAAADQTVSKDHSSQEAIDQLKDNNAATESVLEEAKTLMNDGFLIDAYYKIEQVREQYQKSDTVLKEILEAIWYNETLDPSVLEQIDNSIKASMTEPDKVDKPIEPSLQEVNNN